MARNNKVTSTDGASPAAHGLFLLVLPLATLLLGVATGLDLARSGLKTSQAGGARPGRQATTPTQIPFEGWKQVILRTWKEFNADQIPAVAGGVTFFSLLALFPALGAFVSLYGLISNVEDARRQIVAMEGVLPSGAITVIGDHMTRLTTSNHTGLGFAFGLGLLTSLWSANAGVKALMSGLNVAYEEHEKRGSWPSILPLWFSPSD